MDVWTSGGKYFGYFEDEYLLTYKGEHVGRRDGDEIYDQQGGYLGELDGDRLITNNAKLSWRRPGFIPSMRRISQIPMVRYVGNVMYVGHKHFLGPEAFS